MNIKGKIIEIFDTQQVTDKFQKREFVIEFAENPQYPEFIKFELTQDRCDLIDSFNKGDEIDVFFNIRGRKWTDPQGQEKYFNSLQAWRITVPQDPALQNTPAENLKEPEWLGGEEEDELPF